MGCITKTLDITAYTYYVNPIQLLHHEIRLIIYSSANLFFAFVGFRCISGLFGDYSLYPGTLKVPIPPYLIIL